MSENNDTTGMRPRLGQTKLVLPVTFDYTGGRKDSQRTAKIWSIILGVVGFIIGLGTMFNKKGFFLTNLLIGVLIWFGVLFIIRFFLMNEGKIRQQQIALIDSDYKRSTQDFWGIYSIEDQYPYYCRFRNGKSGVFVRLNKDVILGKYSEAEFEHDEAIGDAYNICGSSNVLMYHVDYMDNVGTDERLENSFIKLGTVTNPDVKDILTDIFTYQQEQMLERVTTFDTYLFLWSGSDINAWSTIQRILSCFMQANYRSYHVLTESDLREFDKVLMNLDDFSIVDAMLNAFSTQVSMGIQPIKVVHGDGSEEIFGKTLEQQRREAELKEKETELKKQEVKRRKARKNNKNEEDEEIDLF